MDIIVCRILDINDSKVDGTIVHMYQTEMIDQRFNVTNIYKSEWRCYAGLMSYKR